MIGSTDSGAALAASSISRPGSLQSRSDSGRRRFRAINSRANGKRAPGSSVTSAWYSLIASSVSPCLTRFCEPTPLRRRILRVVDEGLAIVVLRHLRLAQPLATLRQPIVDPRLVTRRQVFSSLERKQQLASFQKFILIYIV